MSYTYHTHDVYNTKNITVRFEALDEYIQLADMFSEQEEIDSVIEGINNGRLVMFCAKVSILLDGKEIGNDYVGRCIYESYEEFYTKYKFEHFYDMVHNALEEAREEIKEMKCTLSTFGDRKADEEIANGLIKEQVIRDIIKLRGDFYGDPQDNTLSELWDQLGYQLDGLRYSEPSTEEIVRTNKSVNAIKTALLALRKIDFVYG